MNWRPIRGWTRLLHERGMKADSMPERLLIGPGSPPSLDPVYPELSPPLEPCPVLCDRSSPSPRKLARHLETLAERNKFATTAVGIKGRSRSTLQQPTQRLSV